ncbi:MAG: acyl carrier protein [Candidatus Cloacimonetes bacterium]|nr:acyl carrier protein [Candidatus Cloacimonadota bacterium]
MEKFIEQLADVLSVEASMLKDSTKFRDLPEWDSLSVLALLAFFKKSYKITVPRKDFDSMNTVADLFKKVQ